MRSLLDNNLKKLQKYSPALMELVNNIHVYSDLQNYQVIPTKTGNLTLSVAVDEKQNYIHSKYDPLNEAKLWVESQSEVLKEAKLVFIYGLGLGYHLEELVKKYPDIKAIIYEPSPIVFYSFINSRDLRSFPITNIQQLYVATKEADLKPTLYKLLSSTATEIQLLVIPSYSRIFCNQYNTFIQCFKEVIQMKKSNVMIEAAFSVRWTLNSLMNLPYTLNSPNLSSGNIDHMVGKPVIIVSAGPGLSYEYDNLRKIKENKLAYIIAVGSANLALINQGIHPDAVATYDPKETNHWIFKTIADKRIDSIPMIYGTSVGYETLERYPGKKYHIITDKDTVTQYYLHENKKLNAVKDAPSIAVVVYQLLAIWKSSPIIFVGQNFCKESKYAYAIETGYDEKLITREKENKNVIPTIDMQGNPVETLPSYLKMKKELEWHIQLNSNIETINTTKGGLNIEGAPFRNLAEVVDMLSKNKCLFDFEPLFSNLSTTINSRHLRDQISWMDDSIREYSDKSHTVNVTLKNIQSYSDSRQFNKLIKEIKKLDEVWQMISKNSFFNVYIRPILRVNIEVLNNRCTLIQKETDILIKSTMIIKEFKHFFNLCQNVYPMIGSKIKVIHHSINSKFDSKRDRKCYYHDSGVFLYIGKWSRLIYHQSTSAQDEEQRYRYGSAITNERGSKINFQCTGKMLRIYASRSAEHSNNIRITIDDKKYGYSQYSKYGTIKAPDSIEEMVFEKTDLENKTHNVCIEVLDDNYMSIAGVEVDCNGRVFHVDEVQDIEDLQKGKRIRCHYDADIGKVGIFSGMGDATSDFIPPESIDKPSGDFYFIMVGTTTNNNKILVADRNIQHSISWDAINEAGMVYGKQTDNMNMRLLSGGQAYYNENGEVILDDIVDKGLGIWPENNEWDQYIGNSNYNRTFTWNFNDIGSWCQDKPIDVPNMVYDSKRVVRGLMNSQMYNRNVCFVLNPTDLSHAKRGFRPACEISLNSDN